MCLFRDRPSSLVSTMGNIDMYPFSRMPEMFIFKVILTVLVLILGAILFPPHVWGGGYLDSAHGSSDFGVFRPIIGNSPPAGYGYARGNCAHCHEQHGSIAGNEPQPVNGQPSSHMLFSQGFNTNRKTNMYSESDAMCFSCHNSPGLVQTVINNDYGQGFGCSSQGETTIMGSFNQNSYHNLYDIYTYSNDTFSWFDEYSSPCSSCHNPHLARRNWANTHNPAFTAISKPTDPFSLWGQSETMQSTYGTLYEPPYCSGNSANREPDAISSAEDGRRATPDYVGFCTTCHTTAEVIFSTTLNRNIRTIDWGGGGDKHGLRLMDGSVSTLPPYDFPPSGTNLVLSCLDCHEPHGSQNIMLIRRRVNGEDINGAITFVESTDLGKLCAKCHKDDQAAGHGGESKWEYVHHLVPDAPYTQSLCSSCHSSSLGGEPIPCYDCHYHGSTATKPDGSGNFRKGF